jgi:hypothetical protein
MICETCEHGQKQVQQCPGKGISGGLGREIMICLYADIPDTQKPLQAAEKGLCGAYSYEPGAGG